jgi:NADH dehydrogenase/NADH:ubiquinone oxidoreductase subunit G
MYIFLDGKKIFVSKLRKKYLIYQIIQLSGTDIPCFCYSETLSVAGNCRLCMVELKNVPKLVVSCGVSIINNMYIYTTSIRVRKAREFVLELLLINHPLDCPICDQGGECDLQDLTLKYGLDKGRYYEYEKRSVSLRKRGCFIRMVMTRCIHCTRCIRFCIEILGVSNYGVLGRGEASEITILNSLVFNPLSANVIDVCPVGALTSRFYMFNARS